MSMIAELFCQTNDVACPLPLFSGVFSKDGTAS